MKIGFDCDGVLANFNHAYGDLLIKLGKQDTLPKGWKGDASFPDVWDWDIKHGYKDHLKGVWEYIQDPPHNFWGKLDCLLHPDLRHNIMELSWSGNDVYFITNRPGRDAKIQTECWLRGNGLADCPTVLIAEDKIPIILSLNLDFYLDDRLKTMNDLDDACFKRGIDPKDKHFYLLDTPYNREGRKDIKVVGTVQEGLKKAGLWKEIR